MRESLFAKKNPRVGLPAAEGAARASGARHKLGMAAGKTLPRLGGGDQPFGKTRVWFWRTRDGNAAPGDPRQGSEGQHRG